MRKSLPINFQAPNKQCSSKSTLLKHYQTYEGPAEEVGIAVNDTYLKAFSEESGVNSYGEVVDYLIAWHLAL